jgi:hypothetical protein
MVRLLLALTASAFLAAPAGASPIVYHGEAAHPDGLSYVVAAGRDDMLVSGDEAVIDALQRYAHSLDGPVVVAARNGATYRCDGHALARRIVALYAPLKPLSAQERALGAQQRDLGDEQRRLGRAMQRASDADRSAIAVQQAQLGAKQSALGDRQSAIGNEITSASHAADAQSRALLGACLADPACAHPVSAQGG